MSTRTQIILTLFFVLFPGCKYYSTQNQASPTPVPLQTGTHSFNFDDKAVSEFWISKNDAAGGDQWSTRLTAVSSDHWEIMSAPNDAPLVDRLADSDFIQHVLSTLQTLEVSETGLTTTIESAGLSSPKYILRWVAPDATRELVLGQNLTPSGAHYALLPKLTPENAVIGVRGALLGMLDHLKNFDVIRHRKIWTWSIDDVTQFEVYQGPRKTFFAQRQSGEWADGKNRLYEGIVQDWLDRLMHLVVFKFNDNATESAAIFKKLSIMPAYRVILKDRNRQTRSMAMGLDNGIWWGLEDSRTQAVFRMDADTPGYLLPPRVKLKKISTARPLTARPKKHPQK